MYFRRLALSFLLIKVKEKKEKGSGDSLFLSISHLLGLIFIYFIY